MQGRNSQDQQAFFNAIKDGNAENVLSLIDSVDLNATQRMSVFLEVVPAEKPGTELTPLMLAARMGHVAIVKLLCLAKAKHNVDARSSTGDTALNIAVSRGHVEIVKTLLAAGASANICDNNNRSPLFNAVTYQKDVTNHIVDCLLDAGVDVGMKDSSGKTAYEQAQAIGDNRNYELIAGLSNLKEMSAKMLGEMHTPSQLQTAKRYIAKFPKATHVDKAFYNDALLAAVIADNADMITLLVSAGADVNLGISGLRPLIYYAAENNKEKSVEALIKCGAKVDYVEGEHLQTPLMIAVSKNHENLVRILLAAGADVKLKSRNGAALIHCLVNKETVPIAKMLVENGADVNAIFGGERNDHALLNAVWRKNIELAHYLLSAGANTNVISLSKFTTLMIAVRVQDDSIITHLIEKGAAVNCVLDKVTAFSEAVRLNNISAANILLNAGADIDLGPGRDALLKSATSDEMKAVLQEAIALKDMTPEMLAKLKTDEELQTAKKYMARNPKATHSNPTFYEQALVAAAFTNNVEMVKLLIAMRVDVDYVREQSGNGAYTALYAAVEKGYLDVAKLLIENGANLNVRCLELKYSPLMAALCFKRVDCAILLLKNGADINVQAIGEEIGRTAFHIACRDNIPEVIDLLLAHKADLDAICKDNITPLRCAVSNNHVALAHRLIDLGSNVHIASDEHSILTRAVEFADDTLVARLIAMKVNVNLLLKDKTALSLAVSLGKANIVRLLLDAGADIDLKPGRAKLVELAKSDEMKKILQEAIELKEMNPQKFAALKFPEELEKAKKYIALPKASHSNPTYYEQTLIAVVSSVSSSKIEMVKLLLSVGVDVNYQPMNRATALDLASLTGNVEIVKLLLASGADVNVQCGPNSYTPLMTTALKNHNANGAAIIKLLLEKGADVNAKSQVTNTTALHLACQSEKDASIAKLLIEAGANINASRDDRNDKITPIMVAIYNKNMPLANLLIEMGVDLSIHPANISPLTFAVQYGDDALVTKILEKGADVNLKLLDKTALSLAVELDKVSATKILLAAGADIECLEGSAKLLASCQSAEMKKIIKEAIAFKTLKPIQFATMKAATDLEMQATYVARFPKENHSDPLFYDKALAEAVIAGNIASVKSILAMNVNVNYVFNGMPLMHLATKLGHIDIARLLFNNGANIHAKTGMDYTLLTYAAAYSRVEIVELISKADGLEVDVLDNHGQTPLYHAVCQRNLAIAKLLLEAKANPNVVTRLGETCLSYAVKNNFAEMVVLLIEHGADINYEYTSQSVKKPISEYPASAAIKKLMQDANNKQQQPKIIDYLQTAYLGLSQLEMNQLDSPAHLNLLLEIARQELIYQRLNVGNVSESLDQNARLVREEWLSRLNSALFTVKESVNNIPLFNLYRSATATSLKHLLKTLQDGKGGVEMFTLLLSTHDAMEKWAVKHSKEETFYKATMLPLNRIHTYTPVLLSQPVYQGIYTSHAQPSAAGLYAVQSSAAGLYASSASAAYASAVPVQAPGVIHAPVTVSSAYPAVQQYNPALYQTPAAQYPVPAHPQSAPPSYSSLSKTSPASSHYSTFASAATPATLERINAMFLELCAKGDVAELARFLGSNKAYPVDVNTVDVLNRTGLMLACINNKVDMVDYLLLIPHVNVAIRGADGLTAADHLKKHGYQTLPPLLQASVGSETSTISYSNYQ